MRLLWTLLLVALGGCAIVDPYEGELPNEDGSPPMRTSADAYDLRFDADGHMSVDIPFTYTNPTASTVYVNTCLGPHPPVLQRRTGAGWETVWAPIVPACLGPPLEIRPFMTYEGRIKVSAAAPGSNRSPKQWVGPLEGVYRLQWHLYDRWSFDDLPGADDLLPLDLRVSNAFRLRR